MCGFAGCLDLEQERDPGGAEGQDRAGPRPPADLAVRRMTAMLAHRGPDDQGHVTDGPLQLGFTRLAIIDLASGHQPMPTPDRKGWLVFNGEIYNHAELRRALAAEGVELATSSDTEVLLTLLDREWTGALGKLRGMFAFACWDARTGRLLLGRDRFGIKPLYCTQYDGRFWFCSEQRPLAALAGVRAEASAIEQYLRFQYVPEPATALAGVDAVPAGTWLEVSGDGQVERGSWWTPRFHPGGAVLPRPARPPAVQAALHDAVGDHLVSDASHAATTGEMPPASAAAFTREVAQILETTRPSAPAGPAAGLREPEERILSVLRDSVRAHLVSDVPVGAFLSGGIDSSLIAALAREVNPDLHTFSVGFAHAGYSELDVAERTARELGVTNTAYVITPEEFRDELPRIVRDLDTLIADPAAIPLWFVAREARKHVKVVLSGEGADELFGGYRIYRQPWVVRAAERFHPAARRRFAALLAAAWPAGARGRRFLERLGTPLAERYIGNARIFTEDELRELLHAEPTTSALDVTRPLWRQTQGHDDATAMQRVDLGTWLVGDILAKADRMTMAHSLELRVPFLDPEVFAVASTLPRAAKIGGGTTKLALRRAAAGVVPDSVVNRPKLGFPVPIRHWLAGDLHDWAKTVITDGAGDVLDTGYALSLLERHRSGAADLSRRLWTILVYCLWRQHLDQS